MAMILDAFMSKFSELLVQMVQDKAIMLLGVPDEIKKLEQTVKDIRCVLVDAEKKQIDSERIKNWLMQLKDVMYDADDVMDLCQIKAEERADRSNSEPSSTKKGCGFLDLLCPSSSKKSCGFLDLLSCFRNPVFAHEIGNKIKEINLRLEQIAKRKAELGLNESQNATIEQPLVRRVDTFITRTTDSLVLAEDIVGEKIEKDTGVLVRWLIKEEKGVRKEIPVLAIVGMGGIGKTTLAKTIFNDPQIKEEFELRIWTCVSKKVKGEELLKSIIEQAREGRDHDGTHQRQGLACSLQSLVQGKKFLLVLDDVWEESQEVWSLLLRVPMKDGAQGSRLIVTTRNESVAQDMVAAKLHPVEKLSDDDGWLLLIKQVFPNEEQIEVQQFKDIGLELVQKCDGLPLAIKSIGGLLRKKRKTIEAWQVVRSKDAWDLELPKNIHRAFYLSYEDLSSPLKQCFITCSLFPEDYEFVQEDLIYLWFAEGFLQDKGNLWETGKEYFRELLERNLLENIHENYSCRMHDLLWHFAHHLGKDENLILREGESVPERETSSKLRRLSIEGQEVNPEVVNKEKWLRTLLLDDIPENALAGLCKNLSSLRILVLSNCNISTLPNSISALEHLRYLDLSGSEIESVPVSIGSLRNLVYIDFNLCNKLLHIPQSIINLRKLRHLNFRGTKVETFPAGWKNLENLMHLFTFKPPKHDNSKEFSSLDELETLSQLVVLGLSGLERVSEMNIAKRAKLGSKEKLEVLALKFSSLSWKGQVSQTNEKKEIVEGVLNELSPPCSLERLTLQGYFGNCLPNWLNLKKKLENLRYLYIFNCNCFKKFVPLGQLPNLAYLTIGGANSVETVDEEFFWTDIKSRDSTIPAFPELIKLKFKGMANWKEWQWNKGEAAMPKLRKLHIEYCPQLISLPEGLLHHATSLEYLKVQKAYNLSAIENMPTIKKIFLSTNPNLERISNLPSISHIIIENCRKLKIVENFSLQSMELYDSAIKFLPKYLMAVTTQKLRIDCDERLLRKIIRQGERGREWQKFRHIAKVKINSWDDSLYASYQKTPSSFSFTTNVEH